MHSSHVNVKKSSSNMATYLDVNLCIHTSNVDNKKLVNHGASLVSQHECAKESLVSDKVDCVQSDEVTNDYIDEYSHDDLCLLYMLMTSVYLMCRLVHIYNRKLKIDLGDYNLLDLRGMTHISTPVSHSGTGM